MGWSCSRLFIHVSLQLPLCLLIVLCRQVACHTAVEPSFYSAANIMSDRALYDRPRPLPKRRIDIPPKAREQIIDPSRHVNYGRDGHPYEQARRLREEKRQRRTQRTLQEDNVDDHYDTEIMRILQNDKIYQPLRIHFDTVSDVNAHISSYLKSSMHSIWLIAHIIFGLD